MKFLDHLNPYDYKLLSTIDDNWPFQFLSSFSRFQYFYHHSEIKIIYDPRLEAFIPVRYLNLKVFKPAQVLFAPVRNGVELNADEQADFYERMIWALYYNGHCERIVQPHPYSILAAVPYGSKFCEFGTYIVHLDSLTDEQILSNFNPKYQKAVSHSVRNGAVVRFGRDTMEDFYSVYSSTMLRVNMAYESFDYFKVLHSYMGDDHVCSGVVYDNGVPVSGIFLIYSGYSAFLTHAGTAGESRLYGAAKLLNYEMMKHLKAKGVRKYDFVGVRLNNDNPALEGIFRFKKGFGGELKSGYLWKLDLMPMRARLYSNLVRLRSKEKEITDIIDQVSESKMSGRNNRL